MPASTPTALGANIDSCVIPTPFAVRQDTARRIAKVYSECKITIDEEEYVNSFRTEMMAIGYAWVSRLPEMWQRVGWYRQL